MEVKKQFNEAKSADDEMFYGRKMDTDVEQKVNNEKRMMMSDGIAKTDDTRTVIAISY
eukprot:CAMPEP_0176383144 /NCGR_PEP_ID=MMETSP0126-20121128/33255_1 /TAXON_ID=141414 ORGANISM="Strombidinopsis acuminatum, Strain SPMC142" /NCGR_SAMPLE_ID=MMETSP0126 /ASSEMBLY_ACC=CAM_ASM_000229 /LENGTH=57 /DNA_ID=CAMNT_0017748009 /DNA_START=77 /DNA_END=250 /DNA_ORIENTATION=-